MRSSLAERGAQVAPQLLEAPRGAALAAELRHRGVTVEDVPANVFG